MNNTNTKTETTIRPGRKRRKRRSTLGTEESYYETVKQNAIIMNQTTDNCEACRSFANMTQKNLHRCYQCFHWKKGHQDDGGSRHQCPPFQTRVELSAIRILENIKNCSSSSEEDSLINHNNMRKRRKLNEEEYIMKNFYTTPIVNIDKLISQKLAELNTLKQLKEMKQKTHTLLLDRLTQIEQEKLEYPIQ